MCALFDDLIIFRFSNNMTEIKKLKLHLRTSYPPFFKFPVYSFGQKTPKRVNRERRTRPKCCDGRKENKKEKEKEASEADRPAQQTKGPSRRTKEDNRKGVAKTEDDATGREKEGIAGPDGQAVGRTGSRSRKARTERWLSPTEDRKARKNGSERVLTELQ